MLLIALLLCLHSSNGFHGARLSSSWRYSKWTTVLLADENMDDFGDFASAPTIVFVGNLPFTYDESNLLQLAKANGITSPFNARIEKNKKTGKSRGFGYLDFDTNAAAQKSLTQLTGVEVDGRILKLDFDGGTDTPTRGRRQSATSDAYSMFLGTYIPTDTFSNTVSIILYSDVPFYTPPFITILLYTLVHLHLSVLLYTLFHRHPSMHPLTSPSFYSLTSPSFYSLTSLSTGNIPFSMSADDIQHLVRTTVGDMPMKVRLSEVEGRSRGFGHVDFGNAEDVEKAIGSLEGLEIFDRILKAERALGKRMKEVVEERDRPMERQNSGIVSNSIFMGKWTWFNLIYPVVVNLPTHLPTYLPTMSTYLHTYHVYLPTYLPTLPSPQ